MSQNDALSRFKTWHEKHSTWFGWLGLILVALSFVSKEVFPEVFKSKTAEVDKALGVIDTDEAEKRQIANTRTYGADRQNVLDSVLVRLEETNKLEANDGYYIARIERLERNEEIARSGFLDSRHSSSGSLEYIAKTLFTRSFAAMVNIGQDRKHQQYGRQPFISPLDNAAKRAVNEAHKIFYDEELLQNVLNDWQVAERNSLNKRKAQIEARAHWVSIVEYVLFAIGWLISVLDNAIGKPEAEGSLGRSE